MLIRNKLSKIVIREYLLIQNNIYIFFFTKRILGSISIISYVYYYYIDSKK